MENYETLYIILFFIVGAVMGSFYHVVASRLAKNESIITPKSHCESCNEPLKWYELIPIVSYVIQGGKCRHCHTKLNPSYLMMELCTGILFAVCYHVFDDSILDLIVALLFVSALIIIIISDIENMIILDEVLVVSATGIIIAKLCMGDIYQTCLDILFGVLSFLTMYAVKKMGDAIFKQESLGGGDIKLMFLVGLVLGYEMAICNIFLATFIAFPIALFLLLKKKDNIIPFGPFLSMAAIIIFISKVDFSKIIDFIIN